MITENNMTIGNTLSTQIHPQNVVSNNSIPEGCTIQRFDEMEFLPWDNPDNIVSEEAETIARRINENIIVILFLIGAPANIINMAVFYKQGLKDRVNLCLFALSFTDGFYLTFVMVINGEQLHMQFTHPDIYGPVRTFATNHNLTGFFGFMWISQVLSAIIATERCLCILSPLKFQTLLQTKTMAVIIITVYILVGGFFFLVIFRYRIGCVYDPISGSVSYEHVIGEFYKAHKDLITYLETFVYGAGIPGVVLIVVITTTIITSVKLRQIATWRAGTSSSISAREVALTKMLIGNSCLFIVCVTPIGLFRVVCLFFPELNAEGRNQNFYLVGMWVLEMLSFTNATFNIFVYYTMGSRYRETFWALCHRRRKLDGGKQVQNAAITTLGA